MHDLLGPYVAGMLEPEEERKVEEHLETCSRCSEEVLDLRLAHERLMDLAGLTHTPPAGLKERVMDGMPRRETRRVPLAAAAAVLFMLAVVGVLYASGIFGRDAVASATLEPTDLAPQAGGELSVREGDPNAQAELEVWGLPRPGEHEYYELWFGTEEGRMSAGTFTVDADGRDTVYMSVPEEAREYQRVGITLEKFPREPRISSAKVVLGGELRGS
jgi:anti-sigma-K factor RskA/putative zinc finger protein